MSILVSGSIAYDHIMTFPGRFKDHILPDKIHLLNVSFILDGMDRFYGGTAGNICYNLSLLGSDSFLFGTVGHDFSNYGQHLEDRAVDLSLVQEFDDVATASCYITTDLDDNQITGFYPGAMSRSRNVSIRDISELGRINLAIIAPDDPPAMIQHARECQELKLPYIFDPGQQVIALSPKELIASTRGAEALIGNDYEIEMLKRKTGLDNHRILELTSTLIITRGGEPAELITREKNWQLPAAQPTKLLDPTGAGDAFRAGLIAARRHNLDWQQSIKVAHIAAVFAIEQAGTQSHEYSKEEFCQRFADSYGETCPLII